MQKSLAAIDDSVVACVTLRERYLSRLHDLLGPSSVPSDLGDIPLEVGDLLLLLRQATIDVTEAVARWRQDSFGGSIHAFEWEGNNYLLKMCSDLDFLDDTPVRRWVGFSLRRNPFILPESLDGVVQSMQKLARDRAVAEIERLRRQEEEGGAVGESAADTVELGSGVEALVSENFDAERDALHSAAEMFGTLKELPELKPLEILLLSAAAPPPPQSGHQPPSNEAWPSAAPGIGPPPSSLVKGLARVWRTAAKDGDERCLRVRAAVRSLLQEEACSGRLALNLVATTTAAQELRQRQDGLGLKSGALALSIDPAQLVGSDSDRDGDTSSGELGLGDATGDEVEVGASSSAAPGEPQSSERTKSDVGARASDEAALPQSKRIHQGQDQDQDRWRRLARSTEATATYATRVLRRKSSLERLLARTLTLCTELWWLRCSFEGDAPSSRPSASDDNESTMCIRDPANEAAHAIRGDAFALRRARAAIGSCTRRLMASRALLERRRTRLGECCAALQRRAAAHVALVQSLESSGAARRAISAERVEWERDTLERSRLQRKQHGDKLQRSNERWAAQRRDEFHTWREQQKLRLEVAMLWQLQLQPHERHRCAQHFATVARTTFEHVAEVLAYEKSLREQEDRRRRRRLGGSAYGQQAQLQTVVLDLDEQPQQHEASPDKRMEAEADAGSASTHSHSLEKVPENTEANAKANAKAKAEEMEQLLEVSRHVRSRLDAFDESSDGTVERVGFYRVLKDLGVSLSTVQLAAAFAVLDPDDTNAVDTRVFCAALRQAGRRFTCEADDQEDSDVSATQTKEYDVLEMKRDASLLQLRERKEAEAETKARLAAERDSAADAAVQERKARAEARAQEDLVARQKARAARARREKQPIYKRILRVGGELQVLRVLTRPRIGYQPAGWSVQLYLPETSRLLQAEVDEAGLAKKGFDKPAEQVALWAPRVKFTFIDRVGRLRVPRELTVRGNSTLDLAPDQLVMQWTGEFAPLTVKEAAKAAARAALTGALAARMRSARAEARVQQVAHLAAQAAARAARMGLASAVAAVLLSTAAQTATAKLAARMAQAVASQASNVAAQAAAKAETAALGASAVLTSLANEEAVAVARAAASAAASAVAVASAAAVGSETVALELGRPLPAATAIKVHNSATKSEEVPVPTATADAMAPNLPIAPSVDSLVSSDDELHEPKASTPSRDPAADESEMAPLGSKAAANTLQQGETSAEFFSQMEANVAQKLGRIDNSTAELSSVAAESAPGNRDQGTIRPVSFSVQTLPSSPTQQGIQGPGIPALELEAGGIAATVNDLASSDDELHEPKASTPSRDPAADESEMAPLGSKAAANTLQQGETSAEFFSQMEANVAQRIGHTCSEGSSIAEVDAAPAASALQAASRDTNAPAMSKSRAAVLVQAAARGMLAREKFGTG